MIHPLAEFTSVKLLTSHNDFPAGSTGTVVAIYARGEAYEVEIQTPHHGLITVKRDDLA